MNFQEKIQKLQEMIDNANYAVFFGGAGVSTESGIPDFRSKDGLYNQKDVQFDAYEPEYLLSHECLMLHPDVFFEFYRQKMDCRNIEPNEGHKKLAELEAAWKLEAVITQNIDGLHQKAGSKKVYEIHGTTNRAYCMECGEEADPNMLFEGSGIPKCKCGGILRPDVTLYGEQLPMDAWQSAVIVIEQADLLIVGGTSLSVYPANSLVERFANKSKNIVIINMEETVSDSAAQLVFRESIGKVFAEIKA